MVSPGSLRRSISYAVFGTDVSLSNRDEVEIRFKIVVDVEVTARGDLARAFHISCYRDYRDYREDTPDSLTRESLSSLIAEAVLPRMMSISRFPCSLKA